MGESGATVPLRQKFTQVAASLLVATLLWLMVQNLDRSPADFRIPITYDHPADIVKLPGHPTEATIRIQATKPKLRTLQAAEFTVRVNNRAGALGRQIMVLDRDDVSAPFGVVVEQVSPAQLVVTFDHSLTRPVPVRADVQGEPASGYEVVPDAVEVEPPRVRVKGPASLFTEDLVVTTEAADVSRRTTALDMPRLPLAPPGPGFEILDSTSVAVRVPVRPRIARATYDVPVEVTSGPWETTHNPRALRVTIEGPEPSLKALPPGAIRIVLDASALQPQSEDYRLEPVATIDVAACETCKVLTLSQKRVNLRVKRIRARSSADG